MLKWVCKTVEKAAPQILAAERSNFNLPFTANDFEKKYPLLRRQKQFGVVFKSDFLGLVAEIIGRTVELGGEFDLGFVQFHSADGIDDHIGRQRVRFRLRAWHRWLLVLGSRFLAASHDHEARQK
jgi:hypothetical protein